MAYSNPNVTQTFNGDNVSTNFTVNFSYREGETAVIQVEYWDYTDANNPVQQAYVLGVDYTIDESGFPATEINTAAPIATNFKLIIYRRTAGIQVTSFSNGAFPAESVEETFDRTTQIAQENRWVLDNQALLQPIGGPAIDILALSNQVTTNQSDISTNAANITSNDGDIATNAANIATNAGNIGTNAANIATNAANITSNDGDIATNAANIATNAADIATNAAAIALLGTPTLVIRAVGGNYAASNAEIIIGRADNVTVDLPAPTAANRVTVKMDGTRTNLIVDAGANQVDGAGTYTLTSDYESKTFVADGSNWFII